MIGVWVLLFLAGGVLLVRPVAAVVNGHRYLAAAERRADALVDLLWSSRVREQATGRDRDEARQLRRDRSNTRGRRRTARTRARAS